ncbi:MAG: type II toxin-antitoxin system VapC family toxin [Candidatus Solibacter usitatus]|nr:type II toxin-antitoxin system VapC family toxin [Candidatus Solibacter usitatus]
MALYFLETSALVKLYVREPGTDKLLRLAGREASHRLAVLPLARVEFHSAIRRRERSEDIDGGNARRLLSRFEQHLESKFVRVTLNDAVMEMACTLLDRHPLRAYDAVQLAGCLALKSMSGSDEPVFTCADRQLLAAAEAEGLAGLDPAA